MRLSVAPAPERPDPEDAKAERGQQRVIDDAAHVVHALMAEPGITVRGLYARLRDQHGSFSEPRANAAMSRLGAALVRLDGTRRAVHLHLDGRQLHPDILSRLALEQRANAAQSTPPEPRR